MLEYYLLLAIIFFIINGIAYNLAIQEEEKEVPLKQIIKVAIFYFIMALFWPIQLFYLIRLTYEEFKHGKSDRQD